MRPASWRRLLVVAGMILMSLGVVFPAAAAPTPCADLAVVDGSFYITPTNPITSNPIAGQQSQIHFTVHNYGTCSTNTSFVVQWKQTQFSKTGPSTSVGPLAAGAEQAVSLPYTFPAAGNFQTQVNLDTNHAIAETNEVNNLQIYSVTVEKSTIDLVVSYFHIDSNNPDENAINPNPGTDLAGQGITATAWICVYNNGNTATGSFQIAWKPTGLTPALTQNVGGVAAFDGTCVSFDYNYPNTGNFTSTATVDATHLVAETNEFNNSASDSIQVLPALPELYVTNVDLTPADPSVGFVAGQNVHVAITIHNGGFVGTGAPFNVQWKPGNLSLPLSTQAPALDKNSDEVVEFDYTYPNGGNFTWTAIADNTNVIQELNENNNSYSGSILVSGIGINLTITGVDISANPIQGQTMTATVHIANTGNTDAGPFVVSWNPDANGLIVPGVATLTQQVDSLAAGQTMDVPFTFQYPKAGPFHTIAMVDAFNVVSETNETDNEFIKDFDVLPGAIDLVVSKFDLSTTTPKVFDSVTATIRVKNNGSLPTSGFFVEWKLASTDTSGKLVFVPGLNPGQESGDLVFKGTYFKAGSFTTQAIVDAFNQVVEPSGPAYPGLGGEGNNISSQTITVAPLKP